MWESPNVTLARTLFSSCYSPSGGGAVENFKSAMTIIDCVFANSSSDAGGGALYADGGTIKAYCNDGFPASCGKATTVVQGSHFSGNTAASSGGGGAVKSDSNSSLVLLRCSFDGNSATGPTSSGGAVFFDGGSSVLVAGCTIVGNSAASCGGMAVRGATTVTLADSVLASNAALAGDGGGLCVSSSQFLLSSCPLTGGAAALSGQSGDVAVVAGGLLPVATDFQCAWSFAPVSDSGAACVMELDLVAVELLPGMTNLGGFPVLSVLDASGPPGGPPLLQCSLGGCAVGAGPLTFRSSGSAGLRLVYQWITGGSNNLAASFGLQASWRSLCGPSLVPGDLLPLRMYNVSLERNVAAGDGGGISFSLPPGYARRRHVEAALANVTLVGNAAGGCGGGLFAGNSTVAALTSVHVANNTASSGGGLCVLGGSSVQMSGVQLSGNSAPGGEGGGAYFSGASVAINASVVASNSATVGGGLTVVDGQLAASAVSFASNSASDSGGCLAALGGASVVLGGCTLSGCTTGQAPSFAVRSVVQSVPTCLGAASGSAASGDGGGAAVSAQARLLLRGGLLLGNSAANGGGALAVAGLEIHAALEHRAQALAHSACGNQEDGEQNERHQGDLPTQKEHRDDDDGCQNEVAHDIGENVGKGLLGTDHIVV